MKIISYVCFALCFAMVMKDSQGATVRFNEELLPLQVGSDVIEHSLFSNVTELTLAPGVYTVKLQYSDLYELEYDEHEVVESDAFWVELNIMMEGEYLITFERPDEVEEAKLFAKNPQVTIVSPDKNRQIADKRARFMQQAYASQPVVAPSSRHSVNMADPKGASKDRVKHHKAAPIQGVMHPDAATMLEFWWDQASTEQRAAFLQKIKKG
ncbi:hypothetical protein PCIT_a3723 [Pseudoalteromonas citrea]|uniref:DUF2057 domain-containing protein n=2 Tax=Pseudoalteromonas citrea TaxID=43655 RepID=A0AAD4AGD5_9GAMM|nr:DUF2057 family protein [Pseudoalteromonas citrea]KAF7767663.1 hypothetical protein PCIT_a3723 [Pseudoalteromonas citrea]